MFDKNKPQQANIDVLWKTNLLKYTLNGTSGY